MGWYSGKSSDLNPDSPTVRAENLIRLGGGSKQVYAKAQAAYMEGKYQWCLELTEALALQPEDVLVSDINQLQVLSLQKLASTQTSPNGRNWYLTKSLEIQGTIDIKPSPTQVAQTVLKSPLRNIFMLLPINLDYTKANEVNQLALFHFQDTNEKFSIHVRNGIADVKYQWPEIIPPDNNYIMIEVSKEEVWKQMVGRVKTAMAILSNDEILVKDKNGDITEAVVVQFLQFLSMFSSD